MSERKHNHYFKSVEGLKDIDVYRVLSQEAADTLTRWQEMRQEEAQKPSC